MRYDATTRAIFESWNTEITPLCTDPTCPDAWAEHDAHDNRLAATPTNTLCTDPDCPTAWAEHDAH